MFFWKASTFGRELSGADKAYSNGYEAIRSMLAQDDDASAKTQFQALPSISIDHLLMERSKAIAVIPAAFDWDDVGSLDSLARFLVRDANANAVQGDAILVDAHNNLVLTDHSSPMVCLLGVDDLTVVSSGNVIMIVPKDKVQQVRTMVAEVEKRRPDLL
jgi:mannose-1-phosphate guanylyltransferase